MVQPGGVVEVTFTVNLTTVLWLKNRARETRQKGYP